MTPHTLFQHALLDPSQPAPATLSNGQGQEAGDRFDVYRNNVVLSLITAVEAGFHQTRALMGEDVFRSLSAHYTREHLPSSPLLRLYGKTLPSYVEKNAEHLAQHYLADLARLDYALRLSYHSADAPPYDWQNLAHLTEDRLSSVIVDFAPAVSLLSSHWNILELWQDASQELAQKRQERNHYLFVRPEFDPYPVALTSSSAVFIQELMDGTRLSTAIETAQGTQGFDLQATLELLAKQACVTSIDEHKT